MRTTTRNLPWRPRSLPSLLILTDRRQARAELIDVVRAAIDGGARLFVLREKDLPRAQRAELAARIMEPVFAAGALLLGADDTLDVCHGVHLSQGSTARVRRWAPRRFGFDGPVGFSCHDRAEIEAAAADGADYATVSPVFPSDSKPGHGPALGLEELARLSAGTALPLYALGGVDGPERARSCIAAGAAGVAVMGAVMRAPDPQRRVEELLASLAEGAA